MRDRPYSRMIVDSSGMSGHNILHYLLQILLCSLGEALHIEVFSIRPAIPHAVPNARRQKKKQTLEQS